ncbi:MAG: hypothetical protein JWQ49_2472 [Edaphobacter sp.]|nr:hypothetical protein [Edaphobacter sp.]
MAKDFSELNNYAKREYKFAQRDSYRLITQAITAGALRHDRTRGVCMGATLKWINEKLSTSNSYIKSDGRLRGSTQREFSNSINPVSRAMAGLSIPRNTALGKVVTSTPALNRAFKGKSNARNEGTVRKAADVQTLYANALYAKVSVDAARQDMDKVMKTNEYTPAPIYENVPIAQRFGYTPQRRESDTIARAAFGLPAGIAILIELHNAAGEPGHAIAFYRSRPGDMGLGGKTLYFFDANAGVYKIAITTEANIKDFIEAWQRVYERDEHSMTWRTAAGDWCTAFKRQNFM